MKLNRINKNKDLTISKLEEQITELKSNILIRLKRQFESYLKDQQ